MSQEEKAKKTGEEIAANELSDQDLDAVAGGAQEIPGVDIIVKTKGGTKGIAPTKPGGSAKNYNEGRSNTAAN